MHTDLVSYSLLAVPEIIRLCVVILWAFIYFNWLVVGILCWNCLFISRDGFHVDAIPVFRWLQLHVGIRLYSFFLRSESFYQTFLSNISKDENDDDDDEECNSEDYKSYSPLS